jgi:hypothetical protein
MSTTFGSVDGALSADRVKRDLVRLLPLGALLLVLALVIDAAVVTAVVVALGVLCGAVCAIAATVALVASRGRGLAAAGAYALTGALFVAAVVVAVG